MQGWGDPHNLLPQIVPLGDPPPLGANGAGTEEKEWGEEQEDLKNEFSRHQVQEDHARTHSEINKKLEKTL